MFCASPATFSCFSEGNQRWKQDGVSETWSGSYEASPVKGGYKRIDGMF